MKTTKLFACIFLSGILASCAAKELRVTEYRVSTDTPDPTKPPNEYYVLGPGDSLNVQLWKEPTLTGTAVSQ
jgi:protein involved in polysaccharide export with SLBB domain